MSQYTQRMSTPPPQASHLCPVCSKVDQRSCLYLPLYMHPKLCESRISNLLHHLIKAKAELKLIEFVVKYGDKIINFIHDLKFV